MKLEGFCARCEGEVHYPGNGLFVTPDDDTHWICRDCVNMFMPIYNGFIDELRNMEVSNK